MSQYRTLYFSFAALVAMTHPNLTQAQKSPEETKTQCISLLREAVQSAESFFIKVHAAEALIGNHLPQGIEPVFTDLQKAAPDYFLGSTRILARLHKSNPARYESQVDQILTVFLHSEIVRQRLIALESLGKLGYSQPLPQIRQQADHGTDGMKPMARWVLANSGRAEDEAQLAEMLTLTDPLSYRYAAYACRFLETIRPATYALLETCAARIPVDDPQRVYVLSALFVHSPEPKRPATRAALRAYETGEIGERYEVAEALSLRGTVADVPVLEKLLADENQDVRVAAANALLRIYGR
ncbi:hypothetical protein GCM10028803_42620 [Larkinella knui]|uniref:HEAT repeat domain-containing protein n=1 Tax=Larkinella knui TaxID=2025310 RepID=A0A3P1CNV3_9BACT|nr:hypothetical protein [Larkinella knui]RRB14890.1 hypothetical protein EHT87_10000 [Larkinella knui]